MATRWAGKPADLQRAAIVARFHRGALPTRSHKTLRDLLPDEQKATIQLAAILRLANALDASHDGHIRRIQIESNASGQIGNEALDNRRRRLFASGSVRPNHRRRTPSAGNSSSPRSGGQGYEESFSRISPGGPASVGLAEPPKRYEIKFPGQGMWLIDTGDYGAGRFSRWARGRP